jgi:two-component system, OmpR family, KDP operon response regulator KdpE
MLTLVVEDDPDYADIIAHTLRRDAHDVVVLDSVEDACRFSEKKAPELAILDVVLPDGSGLDLCSKLRKMQPNLPVIFLSSMDRSSDVIEGFERGADDYVTKPFHPTELLARVRSVVRRSGQEAAEYPRAQRIQANGVEIDLQNQAAYLDSTNLNCTPIEIDILAQLVRFPGQALSHAFLTEQVWGYKNISDASLLKGHMSSLRRKIRNVTGNEEMIRTVHGVGYSFSPRP